MSSSLFGQIGPYAVERPIGQGGMASVFLARDTRSGAVVALKVVHAGTSDEETREILEAEQRGADLQTRFSDVSRYVPKVFECGFASDYFYIAMEYIAGEDLSQAIRRGRLSWQRAVAIAMQLCEFLEQAYHFETAEEHATGSSSGRVLLHNDLKPRNIRLMNGDEIKVLDFGAAKALSLSRKVTRNDFGSTAYLSPECLDSGERDLFSDAWALGVLLYEMIRGRPPFRGDDTRRLEQRIRSRVPPESIAGYCPPALEAVIAKLLAPYPADRYAGPAEIRADLERVQAGGPTLALEAGWPHLRVDEPATRRTQPPAEVEATQRTATATDDEPPTRRTAVPGHDAAAVSEATPALDAAPPPASAAAAPAPRRRRSPVVRLLRRAAIVVLVATVLNDACVASASSRAADRVLLQDFDGLAQSWNEYRSLAERSVFTGVGLLEDALRLQTMRLANRVIENYRTPLPTVRENQWKDARDALRRALTLSPRDDRMRAALRYCEGHLLRINGEAKKARGELADAQRDFTEAVVAFREAAALRSEWPDPFLGLARTFIYGLDDVDRGADALEQAEKFGHRPGERETTQLADGYRVRGETMVHTADTLRGMAQEKEYLTRARESFREALDRYSSVPGFGNAPDLIRQTQRQLDRVEARLDALSKAGWKWPWD